MNRRGLELCATGGAPSLPVFADPIEQCSLKANVVTQAFRLDPLVAEDLFTLCKEFLVKAGLLYKVARRFGLLER